MDENKIFLSLVLVSLFTVIPIKEAIKVIEDLTDLETSKLVGLCSHFLVSRVNFMNKLVKWLWVLPFLPS